MYAVDRISITVISEFFVAIKFSFSTKRRKFFTRKLFTSNIIYSEYMVHICENIVARKFLTQEFCERN